MSFDVPVEVPSLIGRFELRPGDLLRLFNLLGQSGGLGSLLVGEVGDKLGSLAVPYWSVPSALQDRDMGRTHGLRRHDLNQVLRFDDPPAFWNVD